MGLLLAALGALVEGTGALCALGADTCRAALWSGGIWVASTLLGAWAARQYVSPLWHPSLAAIAALTGLGLLMQTRLTPAAGRHQAIVWAASVALAGFLWKARGGPWARGRGWRPLFALAVGGVALTWRWGVHPALANRPGPWLPLGPLWVHPAGVLLAAWTGVIAQGTRPGRGLSPRTWGLTAGVVALLLLQGDWGFAALALLTALSVHSSQANSWRVWWTAALGALLLTPGLLPRVPRLRQRWDAWLHPHQAPLGYGYQLLAAEAALQRGRWSGAGLTRGHPHQVPLSLTDFIFVAWGEEGGWSALLALTLLEAAVWLGLGWGVARFPTGWPRAWGQAVVSYGAWLTFWVLAGNLRLVPLSGLPLPWVAYGGTALLTLSLLSALIVTRRPARGAAPPTALWRGHLRAWAAGYGLVLLRTLWLIARQ